MGILVEQTMPVISTIFAFFTSVRIFAFDKGAEKGVDKQKGG